MPNLNIMAQIQPHQASSQVLDHLGLVSTVMHKIKLIDKIDRYLPVSKAHGAKVTRGECVASMILNGLGFIDDRLYMFPKFLENKPVDKLLGTHLKSEYFSDDTLGRCLDAIHAYGTTKLFADLAFDIGLEQNLLGKTVHIDTTTLTVYGDYEQELINEGTPKPAYGYSKNNRPDLKQMVLNLAIAGKNSFPVWFQAHSGNASDSKILHEAVQRMQTFCKQLKNAPHLLYVADSAMYERCVNGKHTIKWLCRVPERSKEAKKFVRTQEEQCDWVDLKNGYKIHTEEKKFKGIKQRWALVFSEKAYQQASKTLDKKIDKELDEANKALRKLGRKEFSCKIDAKKALDAFSQKLKYHIIKEYKVDSINHYAKQGRPNKTDEPEKAYCVQATLTKNDKNIEKLKAKQGRFIIATNELDEYKLKDEEILSTYKEQYKIETGFRFIKGNALEVSSVFLKKPERINALMMIMVLCLMLYGLVQHLLRKSLAQSSDTIPNQLGKSTSKPTGQWIFRLFQGVHVLTIQTNSFYQRMVINLTSVLEKIICHFGIYAMTLYEVRRPHMRV